jgi:D-mannonate dehydratase
MSITQQTGDPTIFTKSSITAPAPPGIGAWTFQTNTIEDATVRELLSRIKDIEQRLAIVVPGEELHNKYPALKEAYDHYKLIEALVYNENGKD